MSIRYNPSAPTETSLVGGDPVLAVDPVPGSLTGVVVFAVIAAVCGILARAPRQVGQSR